MESNQITLAYEFSHGDRLPSAPQLAYRKDMAVYLSKVGGHEPQTLFTDEAGSLSCPLAWSPDGQTVYHSHDQIYAIDVATTKSRPVTAFSKTEDVSVTWFLSVSPDGSKLLFLESRRLGLRRAITEKLQGRANPVPPPHIATIRVDGTHYERLIEGTPTRNIWVPQCNWRQDVLVFATTVPTALWMSDTQGKNLRMVSALSAVRAFDLSPDARKVVFSGDQGLESLAVADGKTEQLCSFGGCASWSPDGESIAFMNDDMELCLMRVSDKYSKVLVKFAQPEPAEARRQAAIYAKKPVWSPDARFLWFTLSKAFPSSEQEKKEFAKQLEKPVDGYVIPEDVRVGSIMMNQWRHHHWVGVVDFAERKIWLEDGRWYDVAWRPLTGE